MTLSQTKRSFIGLNVNYSFLGCLLGIVWLAYTGEKSLERRENWKTVSNGKVSTLSKGKERIIFHLEKNLLKGNCQRLRNFLIPKKVIWHFFIAMEPLEEEKIEDCRLLKDN